MKEYHVAMQIVSGIKILGYQRHSQALPMSSKCSVKNIFIDVMNYCKIEIKHLKLVEQGFYQVINESYFEYNNIILLHECEDPTNLIYKSILPENN